MQCAIPVPPKQRSYYITAATAIDVRFMVRSFL